MIIDPSHGVRRVILVVLDGVRADAPRVFGMKNLTRLAENGAGTLCARTVNPSVTAAAMASLFSGATPECHGIQSERFRMPKRGAFLRPLPRVLADHGLPTSAFLSRVPFLYRGLAQGLAGFAGVDEARFVGIGSAAVLGAAERRLAEQDRGLIFMHWDDADRAGHAHGWMSQAYGDGIAALDASLERLTRLVGLDDPSTLLLLMADHGGGGVRRKHHNSTHHHDITIPIVLAGGNVCPGDLGPMVSLLDVPPTVLWALNVPQPASYTGQPLLAAFRARHVAAA